MNDPISSIKELGIQAILSDLEEQCKGMGKEPVPEWFKGSEEEWKHAWVKLQNCVRLVWKIAGDVGV